MDGFRYQVRTPGLSTTSREAIEQRDQHDKDLAQARRKLLEARVTDRLRETRLREAQASHPPGSREVRKADEDRKAAGDALVEAERNWQDQDQKQKDRRALASAEPYAKVSGVVHVEPRKTRTPLASEVCRPCATTTRA